MRAADTPHHFELLAKKHDVSSFLCENEYLTDYLKTQALESVNRDHARTFVCIDEGASDSEAIVGYFTLRASAYQIGWSHVVPVVELVALARHGARKGEDWGNVLLSEALAKVADAARLIGIAGVELNPTDQGVRLYREFGFREHPLAGNTNKMFLSVKMIPDL